MITHTQYPHSCLQEDKVKLEALTEEVKELKEKEETLCDQIAELDNVYHTQLALPQ